MDHLSDKNKMLLNAVNNNDLEAIDNALDQGADINYRDPQYFNATMLHLAVTRNMVKVVKRLLERGAEFNIFHEASRSYPIHNAAVLGHIEILENLIDSGCDINSKDHDGETPILYALEANQPDIVSFLIKKGADINFTHYGKTFDELFLEKKLPKEIRVEVAYLLNPQPSLSL